MCIILCATFRRSRREFLQSARRPFIFFRSLLLSLAFGKVLSPGYYKSFVSSTSVISGQQVALLPIGTCMLSHLSLSIGSTERVEIYRPSSKVSFVASLSQQRCHPRAERYPPSKVGFLFFVSSLSQRRRPREIPITTSHHAWSSGSQNTDYWWHERDRNGRCQALS